MPYINSTRFGEIAIDGKKYGQVLIVGEDVLERDYERLEKMFGTSHQIGDWEIEELLRGEPEIVIVGIGQSGVLKVEESFLRIMRGYGIEVIAAKTPKAIEIYNQKIAQGKKANTLIHTTC